MLHLHTVENPDAPERFVIFSESLQKFVSEDFFCLTPYVVDARIFWCLQSARAGRTRFYNYKEHWNKMYGDKLPPKDFRIKRIVIDQVYMEEYS